MWLEASLESKVQSLKSGSEASSPSLYPAREPGKDAFHRVPFFSGKVTDAVERVPTGSRDRATLGGVLTQEEFEGRFTREERQGCLKVGDEIVPASRMLERFDQMNLSTYLFRAPVLYDALSRLKAVRASGEEYLTDVFEILANRKKPARVVGSEIRDARELMAFNNPQEL